MMQFLEMVLTAMIPGLLMLTSVFVLLIVFGYRQLHQRRRRRSPLTDKMLRGPGESLRQRIEELDGQAQMYLALLFAMPLVVYSLHLSQSYFYGRLESMLRLVVNIGIGAVVLGFLGWKLHSYMDELRKLRLGLEGELATGQELNELMLEGCRVFHDIPMKYGNIDHVVVSKSGVFSVNTKMLGKRPIGETDAKIVVDHNQNIVRFPDWKYSIPVDQLETEANWLKKTLSQATDESIEVEPILALPGWFVKQRIGRSSVYVINPKKPKKFFVHEKEKLQAEMIQRIAHQLDQLCRDVEPSYQQKGEWNVTKKR